MNSAEDRDLDAEQDGKVDEVRQQPPPETSERNLRFQHCSRDDLGGLHLSGHLGPARSLAGGTKQSRSSRWDGNGRECIC